MSASPKPVTAVADLDAIYTKIAWRIVPFMSLCSSWRG
jgi:hypothetical protein